MKDAISDVRTEILGTLVDGVVPIYGVGAAMVASGFAIVGLH